MLTQKQLDLLKFILDFQNEHMISPSYDQMQKGMGLKSKSSIYALLRRLEERGFVERMGRKARSLKIVRQAKADVPRQDMKCKVKCTRWAGALDDTDPFLQS